MDEQILVETTKLLVGLGKGILAADESTVTIGRRFKSINVENTEASRRDYREMLFSTEEIGNYISGVILYHETIRQKGATGESLVKVLQDQGISAGIKVDTGTHSLAGAAGEVITEGLDGLRERLADYREAGARFTKWRAVIQIGPDTPSDYCIEANAHALSRFAALSQEANLVPIVEPEVLMDGGHSIDRCYEVTEATLHEVFRQLHLQRVLLEGMLLKPSMVISGKTARNRASPEEVARKTVSCLMRTVPASMPGIVFLSGGQEDGEATANLNAINLESTKAGAPWELSFSYGRALQAAPLKAWGGNPDFAKQAQHAFLERAKSVSAARQGIYEPQ